MDDSVLHTKAEEGDIFIINGKGNRYLFRISVQETPIRYYHKDSIFLKYRKGCPLFKYHIAQSNKDTVQYLLDCTERGVKGGFLSDTRNKLTCKNMFKCIMKNKVKGLNEYNSCHDCTHFYEGLVPRWESYAQSLTRNANKTDSNPELKNSDPDTPD